MSQVFDFSGMDSDLFPVLLFFVLGSIFGFDFLFFHCYCYMMLFSLLYDQEGAFY